MQQSARVTSRSGFISTDPGMSACVHVNDVGFPLTCITVNPLTVAGVMPLLHRDAMVAPDAVVVHDLHNATNLVASGHSILFVRRVKREINLKRLRDSTAP